MNFSPLVRSWIILISMVLGTGTTAGYTAFLAGANISGACIVGLGVAASNVMANLMKSPADKADDAAQKTSAQTVQTT